jgi:ABC-type lipoprotein export system ATPase subunit
MSTTQNCIMNPKEKKQENIERVMKIRALWNDIWTLLADEEMSPHKKKQNLNKVLKELSKETEIVESYFKDM